MMVLLTPVMVRVNAIATRAYGIISYPELVEAGVPQQTISLWVRSGHLHRVHRGVFSVVPPSMLTQEGRWMAAVKACGPGAGLAAESAAQLAWLLPRNLDLGTHVVVRDRSRRRVPGITIHRPRQIEERDFWVRSKVRTTKIDRAIWDMAYSSKDSLVRDAFELADGHDRLDRARLAKRLREHPNRRGSQLLLELMEVATVPLVAVRSWLEELFARISGRTGLPRPANNVPLLQYEPDFLWEEAKFIVEADGGQHMKRSQRDKDNAKDIAFQRAGYIVRRYSSYDMKREREVAGEVVSILRERLPAAAPG